MFAANADIYFDESLYHLRNFVGKRNQQKLFALRKWTAENPDHSDPEPMLLPNCESQDAWIFRSPLMPVATNITSDMTSALFKLTDFYLGAPRCDNVLAHILSEKFGYHVTNPAIAIHAIERFSVQAVERKKQDGYLYGLEGQVLGTGKNVFVTDEFEF
jgi:hypothetical protein